jgi:pimeloyl-ACP methyl ester carboxylesterase
MRVVAPDLRGFGDSDKPEGVEHYALRRIVADVLAVLDELGIERTHVVGHDFGAVVAWLAIVAPERVERLVAMSVGHPNALRDPSIEQREKAWYQLFCQFAGAAEVLLTRDDWKLFRQVLRGAGDVDRYIADLSRPGALTAGLNWYRANLSPYRQVEPRPPFPAVSAPTLGLWSSGDNYLTEEGMVGTAEHVMGPWRYERIDGASHWIQLDAPARINELLVEFLTS